ncbi:MAG: hypothetical protein AB7O78_01745 [Thermoleophilia bacterium]
MSVTVLTTCHPAYAPFLPACIASVLQQTVQPAYHRISMDFRDGWPVPQLNEMARGCTTEFVSQLAADDVAHPDHLEKLLDASAGADIIWSWCRVLGRPGWSPNSDFDADRLQRENYIPATSLVRTELLADLGWWNPDAENGWEDWDLWRRALDAGAVFRCVPEVTWTYRLDHGMNATFNGFRKRQVPA